MAVVLARIQPKLPDSSSTTCGVLISPAAPSTGDTAPCSRCVAAYSVTILASSCLCQPSSGSAASSPGDFGTTVNNDDSRSLQTLMLFRMVVYLWLLFQNTHNCGSAFQLPAGHSHNNNHNHRQEQLLCWRGVIPDSSQVHPSHVQLHLR